MPSYCIHLAVGNLYAKKHDIKDKNSFDMGIIAPDFAKDKEKSHYSAPRDKKHLIDFLSKKVQLAKYLETNNLDSDYKKGEFLHLVTDFIYFTQFFAKEEIEKYGQDFMSTMYYSYDCIKDYVENKYDIVYPGDLAVVMQAIDEKRKLLGFDKGVTKDNILPEEKLDKFIEFCSSLDLERYAEKVKKECHNIVADEGEFV